MDENLEQKYKSLQQIIKALGKVVVAYSGGVDSTFLLKAAVDTLGAQNVLGYISVSASLAKSQHNRAIDSAKLIGAKIHEVRGEELSDTNYSANKANRCFLCKSHLFSRLADIAKEKGFDHIICGSNFDDKNDYRPGSRAEVLFNVHAPLMAAGLTKNDIRSLSRLMNLPTAETPASPCLASRLAYGLKITEKRLKQIEQAEDFLRQLGLIEFRVRHHNHLARIEVHPEDMGKIISGPLRTQIVKKLRSLGFKYVTIDLQGFRSGSLNELLTEREKKRNI
ncbi:MAG: ATP-dependent sacrificial sulfur transferase LarE [Planctomycetota bacterium]|jgi:uncharacterized protein